MALKTRNKQFVTFEGIDVVKGREAVGLTQKQVSQQCLWSTHKQDHLEKPATHIVVPDDFIVVRESSFAILKESLEK